MKKTGYILIALVMLFSCKDKDIPDVSGIKVDLTVKRFEQDFFAVDTTRLLESLNQLHRKYPAFLPDFATNILGLPPGSGADPVSLELTKQFIRDYSAVKDSADKVFRNFDRIGDEVKQGLRFVKFYFPSYKQPANLVTFIGPMDAFYEASMGGDGDVITQEGLAVGLQLHLGRNFSMYHSEMGKSLYPEYISRRFTPDYIAVNCMKNIIDDLYQEKMSSKPLVEQMIELGKRMYVLEKIMPNTPDTLRFGYTGRQLKGCLASEGSIWNFFLTNNLLFNTERDITKEYVTDGPHTPSISQDAPGNIGLFVGLQIVKKYLSKNKSLTLPQLLGTDARKIFEESKYKPG